MLFVWISGSLKIRLSLPLDSQGQTLPSGLPGAVSDYHSALLMHRGDAVALKIALNASGRDQNPKLG